MKLSELVYQVVKNVKYLEDDGFNYSTFINGLYSADQDYANSINNAMTPINEAIHRLSDRNKIAYVVDFLCYPTSAVVSIASATRKIKKIKAVFYLKDNQYIKVGHREMSSNTIFISKVLNASLYIQYIEDIKNFEPEDYKRLANDINLSSIGITDTMCSYIIEYAQGKLQEPIAPELANMHITRAEQYMDDLDEQQIIFEQEVVAKKYGI